MLHTAIAKSAKLVSDRTRTRSGDSNRSWWIDDPCGHARLELVLDWYPLERGGNSDDTGPIGCDDEVAYLQGVEGPLSDDIARCAL